MFLSDLELFVSTLKYRLILEKFQNNKINYRIFAFHSCQERAICVRLIKT